MYSFQAFHLNEIIVKTNWDTYKTKATNMCLYIHYKVLHSFFVHLHVMHKVLFQKE